MTSQAQKDLNNKLIQSAKDGHLVDVQKCLFQGAEINAKNNDGDIALIWAAWNGRVDVMRELLAQEDLPRADLARRSLHGPPVPDRIRARYRSRR